MIRFDKCTIKTQEAIQAAQEIAQKLNHQEVDCEHMLSALIGQSDGLVRPLLEKLGAEPGRDFERAGRGTESAPASPRH